MNCTRCREALSAMADGEELGVAPDLVDRHLVACDACGRFRAALNLTAPDQLIDRPDAPAGLTTHIVGRLRREGLIGSPAPRSLRLPRGSGSIWRVGLVALAVGQLFAAVSALVGRGDTATLHASHDLGAVELALGASFLLAAFRPHRAAGFVPVLGAVVVCLTLVAVIDVTTGGIPAPSEVPHLVDALALLMLVAVARRHPAPTLRAGVA